MLREWVIYDEKFVSDGLEKNFIRLDRNFFSFIMLFCSN